MTQKSINIDCTTGEITEVDLTPEEIAHHEAVAIEMEAMRQAREEAEAIKTALKASAKAKLVAGEPLTEEEAATIVL